MKADIRISVKDFRRSVAAHIVALATPAERQLPTDAARMNVASSKAIGPQERAAYLKQLTGR